MIFSCGMYQTTQASLKQDIHFLKAGNNSYVYILGRMSGMLMST